MASERKQHHDARNELKKYRCVDSEQKTSLEFHRMRFLRAIRVQIASISVSALTQESES